MKIHKPLKTILTLILFILPLAIVMAQKNKPSSSQQAKDVITINSANLAGNSCSQLLPKKIKPISLQQAQDFFSEVSKLDLKYKSINDCCFPRALRIAEIARQKGYTPYLAYNNAGGIEYYKALEMKGRTATQIDQKMDAIDLATTSIFPKINQFYSWDSTFRGWGMHVAPAMRVEVGSNQVCDYIIDPATQSAPVSVKQWTDFQQDTKSKLYFVPSTDPCIPFNDKSLCKPVDINGELATCANIYSDKPMLTVKTKLVGAWKNSNDPNQQLQITNTGNFSISENNQSVVTGQLQYYRSESTLSLLVADNKNPSDENWKNYTKGEVLKFDYCERLQGADDFINFIFPRTDSKDYATKRIQCRKADGWVEYRRL